MREFEQAVAFLFRRSGEGELTEEEFVRQVSLDLHWFSPKDARRFFEAAQSLGCLVAGGATGRVRPAFDLGAVDVPLDFAPAPGLLEQLPERPAGSVAEELARAASARAGRPLDEVWREVRRKQDARLLEVSAAALLVAAHAGVDVAPFIARVKDELLRTARGKPPTPSAS